MAHPSLLEPAPPLTKVVVRPEHTLDDFAAVAHLAAAAGELRAEAASLIPRLSGRTIWFVSSTATGGGVAEMLPSTIGLLRDLGLRAEWVVIGSREPAFFALTKRLHNLIHGEGDPGLNAADRELFERVSLENAIRLRPLLQPGDVLVVHDPQPVPMARYLRPDVPLLCVWRCHIGLDESSSRTRSAWNFLAPYLAHYDHAVFSAPEYIPEQLAGRASVICPGIDPLAAKNRDLSLHETVDILCRAALIPCPGPTVQGPYHALARRALPDGTFAPANVGEDIGLLSRPIVTQISRWDRLKGFLPLLRGFVRLKQAGPLAPESTNASERRRLDLVRLVLAGPDPTGVADDPEAADVLNEILAEYASLHRALQDDIALIVLPMESVEENALMVNALQRASTIAIQNSLREGFGLTIAEAMWKRIPVLSNSRACGPRQQVRDGVDGRLVRDPENVEELERAIREMLAAPDRLVQMGRAGQRRVHDGLLVLAQLRSWGRLLGATLEARLLTGPPV